MMFTVKIYENAQWKVYSNHADFEDAKQTLRWLVVLSDPGRRPEHAAVFDQRGKAVVA